MNADNIDNATNDKETAVNADNIDNATDDKETAVSADNIDNATNDKENAVNADNIDNATNDKENAMNADNIDNATNDKENAMNADNIDNAINDKETAMNADSNKTINNKDNDVNTTNAPIPGKENAMTADSNPQAKDMIVIDNDNNNADIGNTPGADCQSGDSDARHAGRGSRLLSALGVGGMMALAACAPLSSTSDDKGDMAVQGTIVNSTQNEEAVADEANDTGEFDEAVSEDTLPQLDLSSTPAGTLVMSAEGSEDDAVRRFASVLAADNISGKFSVNANAEGGWDLSLLELEPSVVQDDIGDIGEVGDGAAAPPSASYYYDYLSTSGTKDCSSSVTLNDTSTWTTYNWMMYYFSGGSATGAAQGSWSSSGTYAGKSCSSFSGYIITTLTWNGVTLGWTAGVPSGFSATVSSSTQRQVQVSTSPSSTSRTHTTSWCIDTVSGFITSRSVSTALYLSTGSTSILLSKSASGNLYPDGTRSSEACP